MPGMSAASALAYSLLANSLYLGLALIGLVGLIISLILSYGLQSLGLSDKRLMRLTRSFSVPDTNLDNSLPRYASFINTSFGILWIFDGILQMRPDMPGGFVQDVALPSLEGAPHWIISIATPLLQAWNAHPVHMDITTAWIQILLGIGILITAHGLIRQLILILSVFWSFIVLVIGNGFGFFYSGASWLSGAPGAVYLYIFAALYLLGIDKKWKWTNNRSVIAWALSVFIGVGVILQAIPAEGYFSNNGISSMVSEMASARQPNYVAASLRFFSHFAAGNATIANWILILMGFTSAIALLLYHKSRYLVWYALVCEFLVWLVGMDLGVFSPTATDPNSGLPAILLCIALLLEISPASNAKRAAAGYNSGNKETYLDRRRLAVFLFGASTAIISVVVATVYFFIPASAAMATVDSGGISVSNGQNLPNLNLAGNNSTTINLRAFSGTPTILTIYPSGCRKSCTDLEEQILTAASSFNQNINKVNVVAIVSIDSSGSWQPITSIGAKLPKSSLNKFTMLGATSQQIIQLENRYGVTSNLESSNSRSAYDVFFLSKSGKAKYLISASGNTSFTNSYISLFRQAIRKIIK